MTAEEKIASSLAKEVYNVKIEYYEDVDLVIASLKNFRDVTRDLGLSSAFLDKLVERKFDHKEARKYVDKICNEGISSRAVIACRKDFPLDKRGFLAYVPVLIKDNIETFDFPLTLGTNYYRYLPQRDSEVVSKLRSTGSLLIGITNMHELALGTTGVNLHYGTPLNPQCPDRIPGGSSSGSASAVAQDLVPIALGNDAGGSVRVPAAFTGVVGFKFSREYVSPYGSRPELSRLSSLGIFSKNIVDVVPVFEALRRGSSSRITNHLKPFIDKGIRVLVVKNLLEIAKEPILSLFKEFLEILKNLSPLIKIEEGEIPLPNYVERARVIITLSDAFNDYLELYKSYEGLMGQDVAFLLGIARNIPAWAYLRAKEILDEYKRILYPTLTRYDIVLTPTVSREPPRIEDSDWKLATSNKLIELATLWNVLEAPAVNLPVDLKLPCGGKLGVQLASIKGDEELVASAIVLEHAILKE